MSQVKALTDRLDSKESTIGILGLGYVGLPLALRFSQIGYKVIGFDIDSNKVSSINKGKSFIKHILDSDVKGAIENGFKASSDLKATSKCDALIICVPTPLNKYREPDLSYVIKTVESFVPFLRQGQIISLESTTYPGTTEEELVPRIESAGHKVGKDVFLVYSPEREDPGNINFSTNTIPKLLGGVTKNCSKVGLSLYGQAIDNIVQVSDTKTAEMTKLLENIHRAVNIGLVNEMKIVADRMGIDIFEVIDAAATKPFGFTAFYPGPGLGGHCIPIDPFYLTWKAKEFGLHTRFIELAGEINNSMPSYVLEKLTTALNHHKKSLSMSKILILGLAYKKNVDDMRESPTLEIMELLNNAGSNFSYSDPFVPVFPKMRDHYFKLKSEEITSQTLKKYDAVILSTDHDNFDYELIQKHSKLIIDCRGVYDSNLENIIKA